jgi:hypothetical protein
MQWIGLWRFGANKEIGTWLQVASEFRALL